MFIQKNIQHKLDLRTGKLVSLKLQKTAILIELTLLTLLTLPSLTRNVGIMKIWL